MHTMAKPKSKKEGKIKNDARESAVDFAAIQDEGEQWHAKSLEAESETKLSDDKGEGEVLNLRFFDYAANPAAFKDHMPTATELFNAHAKQIEVELWKDEWTPATEVEPRILFAKDKSHYRIVIAARPAKGSTLSYKDQPKKLDELLAHDNRS